MPSKAFILDLFQWFHVLFQFIENIYSLDFLCFRIYSIFKISALLLLLSYNQAKYAWAFEFLLLVHDSKIWNASWICVLSLGKGHVNLYGIVPCFSVGAAEVSTRLDSYLYFLSFVPAFDD